MHESSIGSLISPTVNFLILVLGLAYLLKKPVKEMVANRAAAIKTQVEEARVQKMEAERKYREFDERLNAFEAEAKSILERARADGEAVRTKIISDAQASADRIVKDAESTVQANLQEYKDQIRKETIAKAVELAERVIRERLSSDDQRRIVNEYVEKVQ
jgi:F-type H+-transporting ATPase subunit b